MKNIIRCIPFAVGLLSPVAQAATVAQDSNQLIQDITTRTQALEQEIRSLKAELRTIKHQSSTSLKQPKTTLGSAVAAITPSPALSVGTIAPSRLPAPASNLDTLPQTRVLALGASPVITGPYIGIQPSFDGSNLIVNIPAYNNDVVLMQQRQKMEAEFAKYGLALSPDPLLILSGEVAGQVIGVNNYVGNQTSDVNLTTVEVDFTALINRWVTAFIAVDYNDAIPSSAPYTRTSNSNLYVDKGFITVGNLNELPVYATLGQRYVPFGHYTSYMISDPLTKIAFRTRARALLGGYETEDGMGPYATIYTFRGDTYTGTSSSIDQAGADIGYKFAIGGLTGNVGGGAIANVADSLGMQNTGNNSGQFQGFGWNETIVRQVPGANARLNLGWGPFSFISEYVGATSPFNAANLSFNNAGAKPAAYQLEGVYSFRLYDRPTSMALGYNNTSQALALGLPQNRYLGVWNVSVWRNTIQSLEFRHDIYYPSSDQGSGQGQNVPTPTSRVQDTITAQFAVYF